MSDIVKVAVDAMGGDYAPEEPVKGAVEAVNAKENLFIYLVGQESIVKKELAKYSYPADRMEIVPASEVIETGEPPVQAIQKKKDSSLVKALRLVRQGEASAFVSCGSTGAVLVGGQVLVGKIKGVERAPLAPLIPTAGIYQIDADAGCTVGILLSGLRKYGNRRYQDPWKSRCEDHWILSGNYRTGGNDCFGYCLSDQSGYRSGYGCGTDQ